MHLTPTLRGCLGILNRRWGQKTLSEYQMVRKVDDMCIRLDTILRDGQTYRQTEMLLQYRVHADETDHFSMSNVTDIYSNIILFSSSPQFSRRVTAIMHRFHDLIVPMETTVGAINGNARAARVVRLAFLCRLRVTGCIIMYSLATVPANHSKDVIYKSD